MCRRGTFACRRPDESGVAMLLAVVGLAGVSAVSLALTAMLLLEAQASANARALHEMHAAASAALELAVADLARPGWTAGLADGPAPWSGETTGVVGGWGAMDIRRRTLELQRTFDARSRWGPDGTRWVPRLEGYVDELIEVEQSRARVFVMTWVGDDPTDGDADASRDANGVVELRVETYASPKARVTLAATVRRHAYGVEVISWRHPTE